MTQKLWLKKLKLNYSSNVIDIVQFGSSIFEDSDPNDIDMGIIFKKIPIRTQPEESQKIKNQFLLVVLLTVHFHQMLLNGVLNIF